MPKPNILKSIAIILISIGLVNNFFFIIFTGDRPAPIGRLTIDSISYIKGADSVIEEKNILNLKDIYHSPGFQIFLAGIFLIFGRNMVIVKILFFILTIFITLLIIYMGEKFFQRGVGYIAGMFSIFSFSFTLYSATIQYEILVTFLILIVVFFTIKSPLVNKKIIFFIIGSILSFISIINTRFITLAPITLCYFIINLKFGRKILLPIILFLIGYSSIVMPWSLYQSYQKKEIVIVQTGNLFRLRNGNNPNAKGYAYPYPPILEPSGLNFIRKYPAKFLWLIKERFLYFWNFKDDIWKVSIVPYKFLIRNKIILNFFCKIIEKFINIVYFFIFIFGVIVHFFERKKLKLPLRQVSIFHFVIIGTMVIPLMVFATPRFCIPILPYVYIFQAYFIVRGFEFVKSYVKYKSFDGIHLF